MRHYSALLSCNLLGAEKVLFALIEILFYMYFVEMVFRESKYYYILCCRRLFI